jgi:flagellar protein FliS
MRKALTQYKKTAANTGSKGRILLMLYDGAIRFLEQAKVAMEQKRPDLRGARLTRAHAIISELNVTLDHEVAPELCQNLSSLYRYMLDEITEANRHNDKTKIDTITELLTDLRGAWSEAVRQTEGQAQTNQAPAPGQARVALSVAG